MNSFERHIYMVEEDKKLKEIKTLYGRTPKEKCPKCHRRSLFMTNKDNEVYCVRCDSKVAIREAKK